MQDTFLKKVLEQTRGRVDTAKELGYGPAMRSRALKMRDKVDPQPFKAALLNRDRPNVIAEIKRASPSKGPINPGADVRRLAAAYTAGGAAAISVLTEPVHFLGSISDLRAACETSSVPVLRKDFIVDEYQVFEAAAAGADAVLLIVAALSDEEMRTLANTVSDLGMDALVEVHTEPELERAQQHGFSLIGINNRNLETLEVTLDVSRELIKKRRTDEIIVAESGISSPADINELRRLGFNGFLIGESLMRSPDPAGTLNAWISEAASS